MIGYLFAGLLLPWVTGWLLLASLQPRPIDHATRWLLQPAAGFLLGIMLVSLLLHIQWWLPIGSGIWFPLSALLFCSAASSMFLLRRSRTSAPAVRTNRGTEPLSGWQWTVIATLGVLALLRLWLIGHEIVIRPTLPWDAWATWAYQAKALWLTDGAAQFLPINQWVAHGQPLDYPNPAYRYPTLIAGYQAWLAGWLGVWNEQWLNLPWFFSLVALVLTLTGEIWRQGAPPAIAATAGYLLLSLPFLNTHAALAGYMDLWLALALLVIVATGLQWFEHRHRPTIILLGGLIAGSLFIKLEAVVWIGLAVGSFLLLLLPVRRAILLVGVFPLAGTLMLLGGVDIQLGGTTLFALDHTRLVMPWIGEIRLSLALPWQAVGSSLFLSWNWHLLFPALLIASLCGLRNRPFTPPTRWLILTSLVGAAAIAFLFSATQAATWAEDFTSFDRIKLQWVPLWLLTAVLVNIPGANARHMPQHRTPDAMRDND